MLKKLNQLLFMIMWVRNLMLISMYYNLIYMCLLNFRLNQRMILVVFKIYYCTSTFVCSYAFACWFVDVCFCDCNYDMICICCYNCRFDVISICCYCCSFVVGSIWSSCISLVLCSLVCIWYPISVGVDPYTWELTHVEQILMVL